MFISKRELKSKILQYFNEILWDIEIKKTTESLASEYLIFIRERVN